MTSTFNEYVAYPDSLGNDVFLSHVAVQLPTTGDTAPRGEWLVVGPLPDHREMKLTLTFNGKQVTVLSYPGQGLRSSFWDGSQNYYLDTAPVVDGDAYRMDIPSEVAPALENATFRGGLSFDGDTVNSCTYLPEHNGPVH